MRIYKRRVIYYLFTYFNLFVILLLYKSELVKKIINILSNVILNIIPSVKLLHLTFQSKLQYFFTSEK